MTKYICDLCGKEANENEYELPIMNREGELRSIDIQLCEDCCNKFDNLIRDLSTTKTYKNLSESVSLCDEDW